VSKNIGYMDTDTDTKTHQGISSYNKVDKKPRDDFNIYIKKEQEKRQAAILAQEEEKKQAAILAQEEEKRQAAILAQEEEIKNAATLTQKAFKKYSMNKKIKEDTRDYEERIKQMTNYTDENFCKDYENFYVQKECNEERNKKITELRKNESAIKIQKNIRGIIDRINVTNIRPKLQSKSNILLYCHDITRQNHDKVYYKKKNEDEKPIDDMRTDYNVYYIDISHDKTKNKNKYQLSNIDQLPELYDKGILFEKIFLMSCPILSLLTDNDDSTSKQFIKDILSKNVYDSLKMFGKIMIPVHSKGRDIILGNYTKRIQDMKQVLKYYLDIRDDKEGNGVYYLIRLQGIKDLKYIIYAKKKINTQYNLYITLIKVNKKIKDNYYTCKEYLKKR
jgi:hypothetical protein